MKRATAEQRIFAEIWRLLGNPDYEIVVYDDSFLVLTREVSMYKIADAYAGKVLSKGWSANLHAHYVSVSMNLPQGFLTD